MPWSALRPSAIFSRPSATGRQRNVAALYPRPMSHARPSSIVCCRCPPTWTSVPSDQRIYVKFRRTGQVSGPATTGLLADTTTLRALPCRLAMIADDFHIAAAELRMGGSPREAMSAAISTPWASECGDPVIARSLSRPRFAYQAALKRSAVFGKVDFMFRRSLPRTRACRTSCMRCAISSASAPTGR